MSHQYDAAAIADAVDRAAALLSQAAAEIHIVDVPYNALHGVNALGRVAVFVTSLPWLRINFALLTLVALVVAAVCVYKELLIERFDDFVTKKVLVQMQERLAGKVTLGKVKVRPRTVTVEDFTLGNPPTAAFTAPFLVSMKSVHVKCNPLSLAGVRGKGNFIVGWMYGEIELMAVQGAVVYVDEVVSKDEKEGSTKKIRNFQNMRRQSAAAAAAEREAEEAAIAAAAEEKRKADEAAVALAEKKGEAAPYVSFFGSIGNSLSAAQAQIDAQLMEVTAKAMELPGNISSGIQQAGQDVTNRLSALVNLLERVNQKPPEETEEERRKKRRLTLELAKLVFSDWSIHILVVSSKPFTFRTWELEKFRGAVGALARECASGLLNEIIKDFQQEILNNLTKDIAAVGDGLLNVGSTVIGGVAEGGNMIVGGVSQGADAVAKGLSDTGGAVAKGLSDTGGAVAKGFEHSSTAVSGFFSSVGESVGLSQQKARLTAPPPAGGAGAASVAASSESNGTMSSFSSFFSSSSTTTTTATATARTTATVEEAGGTRGKESQARAAAAAAAEAREKEEKARRIEQAEKEKAEAKERAEKQKPAAAADAAKAKAKADVEKEKIKEKEMREAAAVAAAKAKAAKEKQQREQKEKEAAAKAKADAEGAAAGAKAEAKAKAEAAAKEELKAAQAVKAKLAEAERSRAAAAVSSSTSAASSLASSPLTSPRGPRPPGAFLNTHLVKMKYLKKVFEIVDADGKGKIKVRTFMTALGQVPKIGKLLDKGATVTAADGDAAQGLMGDAFAKLEKDRKREVSEQEFTDYFLWVR